MVKPSPTLSYRHSALAALTYSRLNLLLVFIPIVSFVQLPSALSFLLSALTILSLSTLLGYGTEQIQLAWGTGGALLNATLGNLVELIIAIVALRHVRFFSITLSDCCAHQLHLLFRSEST